MDLEQKLKSLNAELFDELGEIKKFCYDVWKDRLLPWFTNHDCEHSKEIVHLLDQILKPLESHPQFLNDHELFILLSSAYLHDIGMQFLKIDDIPIDRLTGEQYNIIRKRHADESYNIILKLVSKSIGRDDFHLPSIDEEYIPAIARVSRGHSSDFFKDILGEFRKDTLTPKGREVRGELLTSLLMIADEFDLQCKRVSFTETAKYELSDYSKVHWYKHHYVDFVSVESGTVKIILKFPDNADTYKELIKTLIEIKLKKQIGNVNPVFMESTSGILHLNPNINFDLRTDRTGVKREMPEEVIKELERLMAKDVDNTSSDKNTEIVIHSYPKPINIFTGRGYELKRFKETFSISSFISIEGLGGIGKTEFAAKCIEEFLPADKVVWLDCLPDSRLDALIDNSGYPDVLKGENKTELAKYSGFTDLIERDQRIIFLDNFQDVLDPSFKNFFKFAERRLCKAKIVLISRETPDAGVRTAPVSLNGLRDDSFEYATRLIETYYNDVKVSNDSLKEICNSVKGHPFAIELAIQLLRYGEAPDNILKKIIEEKDKGEQLSSKLLDEIFRHPRSTEEERKFMLQISIFRGEVDKNAILYVVDVVNISDTLRKLYDKKMISRSSTSNLYSTHPLIREFCYRKLENKRYSHQKAAEYFQTQRKDDFDPAIEEEIFYHLYAGEHFGRAADLIAEQGRAFILLGYTNSLIDMIGKINSKISTRPEFHIFYGDILTIRGEWDKALKYYENAFSFHECDEKIMAEAYIKFGEILFRKGEVKKSLNYFEDAYRICQKKGYKKEEARSLNDIGLVLQTFGNMSLAEKKLNEALLIREEIADKQGIADTLNNIALLFSNLSEYDQALSKHRECLKIRKEISDKQGTGLSLLNIALTHESKGELKEALDILSDSLRIAKEIGDKQIICVSLQGIAASYRSRGQTDKALDFANESLQIAKEIGFLRGLADAHVLIGELLSYEGKIEKALEHSNESLRISSGIGEKTLVSMSLNSLGNIFLNTKDWGKALEKYKESLMINEEIGDKRGISTNCYNLGLYFKKKKEHVPSLDYLLKSFAIRKEIGIPNSDPLDRILEIRKYLGLKQFKELANNAYKKLDENLKVFVSIDEFFETAMIYRETPKIGRNDPCPCGSGKKFKKCCGATA